MTDAWDDLPLFLLRLFAAFALALPVGWDREQRAHAPGLRTFPLLSMGACAYMLIGQHVFKDHLDAQARVFQALISGIGFIGAGSIIKGSAEVRGMATAVSLWVTVSVGIAAAYGLYAFGAILSITTLLVLRALKTFKKDPSEADTLPREDA